MTTLNQKAKRVIEHYPVHACTDVTGFGLAGHSVEMAEGSHVTLEIFMGQVPVQEEALEYARMGLVPAGMYRNRSFTEERIELGEVEEARMDLFFDPQTSGGLLISVSPDDGEDILRGLKEAGIGTSFAMIGRVTEPGEKKVRLLP